MQLAPTRTHDDPKRQRQTPRTPNALPENHRESEMTTGRAGEQASKQASKQSSTRSASASGVLLVHLVYFSATRPAQSAAHATLSPRLTVSVAHLPRYLYSFFQQWAFLARAT
ncbi:hypothetical protein PMIN04_011573 [Paraphaeosphaeria minitans]